MSSPLPNALRLDKLATPIGTALLLTDDAGALRALDWQEFEDRVQRVVRLHYRGTEMREGARLRRHAKR